MRILILSQFFDPEPASIPGLPLASWLADRGHEVEVVTGFPNYPGGRFYPGTHVRPYRRERMGKVDVNRVILYPSHDRSPVRRIANYASFSLSASTIGTLLTRSPDVVYVYHPPATVGLPALLWKALRGAPFVFHVQDLWPESVTESGMVTPGRARAAMTASISWWCQKVYAASGAVVALSDGMKAVLVERGVPEEKVFVIPNWVDESVTFPAPRDPALAERLGTAGRFTLMYSGNLGIYQNLATLLHAAELVRDDPTVQIVLVGSGQMEPELRALTEKLALGNVRFLGRMPYEDMAPVTALADALLVSLEDRPFFTATIPGKTQVAMASARPIVMAVKGDAARIVDAANCGIVTPPGDAHALAAAIRDLAARSEGDLTAMGQRGRDYYEEHMSLDSGAQRLESVLADVAGRRVRNDGAPRTTRPRRGRSSG